MSMNESFAFSDLCRRVANLIRIGKIAEVDGARVKVQIGKVKTNWLPIISTAGDTNVWIPITVGEQVAVVSPYGEMAQSFVIRSIHYNKYAVPEKKDIISMQTKSDVKAESNGKLEALFKEGFELKANDTYVYVQGNNVKAKSGNAEITVADGKISCNSGGSSIISENDQITLTAGGASITLSSDGIRLNCGSSTMDISSANISLNSSNISTTPPVCKCTGGL
jgi:phage baseplate assembly protein V